MHLIEEPEVIGNTEISPPPLLTHQCQSTFHVKINASFINIHNTILFSCSIEKYFLQQYLGGYGSKYIQAWLTLYWMTFNFLACSIAILFCPHAKSESSSSV